MFAPPALVRARPNASGVRLSLLALLVMLAVQVATARIVPSELPYPAADTGPATAGAAAAYARLPMRFEANRGQTDERVRFVARGAGYALFLTPGEAVLALKRGERSDSRGTGGGAPTTVRMRLAGGNPSPRMEGRRPLPGATNYLLGDDPAAWRTGIPSYGQVRYRDIYPGVDMVYYGTQRELEYDFLLAPGASARSIRLRITGAERIAIDRSGDLVLSVSGPEVRHRKPFAYQRIGTERREIPSRYVLRGDGEVGFETGPHDPRLPLTIDPVVEYSTYLGAETSEAAYDIAADATGSAYVTGYTSSYRFPATEGAYDESFGGDFGDAFVAKLDPDGSSLAYATYLGGRGDESGSSVAVDAMGHAYVTGNTSSRNFPTTRRALDPTLGGHMDAFVAKLDRSGRYLLYSTFLGGEGADSTEAIALDVRSPAEGWSPGATAYLTGWTTSSRFPTTRGAFDRTFNRTLCEDEYPCWDAFVSRLDLRGDRLLYSTFLGGTRSDTGRGIAVDAADNAYVTGETSSQNFPTTSGALDRTYSPGRCWGGWSPCHDAFVTKLDPTGSSLRYSTYYGGTGEAFGFGIAIDPSGYAYVAGETESRDLPTTRGAYDRTPAGGSEAFVLKLDRGGGRLVYATYLGGRQDDAASSIAVDARGRALVAGGTHGEFPTTHGAFDRTYNGDYGYATPPYTHGDAFVTRLNAAGTGLSYSTYLGSRGDDRGWSIAISRGTAVPAVYVAGGAGGTNFPTTPGAHDRSCNGSSGGYCANAFVTRMRLP